MQQPTEVEEQNYWDWTEKYVDNKNYTANDSKIK